MTKSETLKSSFAPSLVKTTRATWLTNEIRQSIIIGSLKAGQKIGLDQLRLSYDVSLSPLREAVSRLVSSQLIEAEDQRGYRIAAVSRENLEEILFLRMTLESQALYKSIEHGDVEWESSLLKALHNLKKMPSNDLSVWHLGFSKLHRALWAACPYPITKALCASHLDLFSRYFCQFSYQHSGYLLICDQISNIVDAALERDNQNAQKLLANHIQIIGQDIQQVITTKGL